MFPADVSSPPPGPSGRLKEAEADCQRGETPERKQGRLFSPLGRCLLLVFNFSLRVQTLPKKVFWGGFRGLNPFSGGTWTLRVCGFGDVFRLQILATCFFSC